MVRLLGPYVSGSSDIGTSVIYVLVFAGLLALAYYTGPDRYSVDYRIESPAKSRVRSG